MNIFFPYQMTNISEKEDEAYKVCLIVFQGNHCPQYKKNLHLFILTYFALNY